MSTQIAVRLPDDLVAFVDDLVSHGLPPAVPLWCLEPSNGSVVAGSRNGTRRSSPAPARTPTWTASPSTRPPRRWTTSTDAPHSFRAPGQDTTSANSHP